MNTKKTSGFTEISTRSRESKNRGTKRQDWGFTDQYRRMMQRDLRKKTDQANKE